MDLQTFVKLAEERVSIPEGGLSLGLLANDLTQVMSPADAAMVREKLPWYRRTGPGIVPMTLVGAAVGTNLPELASTIRHWSLDAPKPSAKARIISAIANAAILGGLPPVLTRLGVYDKQALIAARKMIEKAEAK